MSNPSNAIVTSPPPIFTDTSTSPTLDSPQPTTTDCTLESITSTSVTDSTPPPNPTTAPSVLPFPPLPSSSLLSTQPPTKRIHSSISSSPSPRIAKLPRILPTSKPTTTTSSSNKMPNADEPPEYFTKFSDEMRKQNYEILQAIHTSTTRQQQEREEDRQDINALKLHNIGSDKCEVVIYGLPLDSSLSFSQAASKLISILSLPPSYSSESTFREWTAPIPNFQSSSKNDQPTKYKAFVMRLPNSDARDRLAESAPALRSLKAQDIFGEGGAIPVYIRPLWPPAVHKLFSLAIRSSAMHGFVRPTVSNRVVCLRQTFRSPLIPVYSENELYRILPPLQARFSNNNNFPNPSAPNNGPTASLPTLQQFTHQTPVPVSYQPIIPSLLQLQYSTPPTSTSSLSQALIPPLLQNTTPLLSPYAFNPPHTLQQHAQPTQTQFSDYSHLLAAPSTQHRPFTPPASSLFNGHQTEHQYQNPRTNLPPSTTTQQQHFTTPPPTNASQHDPPINVTNPTTTTSSQ